MHALSPVLRRRAQGVAGYTLVEISVSLLVVGIGFASLLAVFPVGLKWSAEAAANSTACLAAQTAINNYQDATYQATVSGYYLWIEGIPADAAVVKRDQIAIGVYVYAKKRDKDDGKPPVASFTQTRFLP